MWFSDGDRDGYGTDAFTVMACAAPSEEYSDQSGDCDDTAAINPGAEETCAPYDEDCDDEINEGEEGTDWDRHLVPGCGRRWLWRGRWFDGKL